MSYNVYVFTVKPLIETDLQLLKQPPPILIVRSDALAILKSRISFTLNGKQRCFGKAASAKGQCI